MRHIVLLLSVGLLACQQSAAQDVQTVQVRQNTAIRSGPSDDSYEAGLLRAGEKVNVLEWPRGGSRYAKIEAPSQSLSLIPTDAVDHTFSHHQKPGRYPTHRKEDALIDGYPPNHAYLSTNVSIPVGSAVVIVGEKTIPHPVTKKSARYYQIHPHPGEFRYVHADNLEGGPVYSQPNFPTLTSNSNPNSMWGRTPAPSASPPSELGEVEQLPPSVINEIHAADLAYHEAITTRNWEDARQRYSLMTASPYASVRILAINRLEFIRQWQLNPQPVLPARQIAEGVTVGMPQYPPANSIWTPGGEARPTVPANLPPKQVTIHPDQPPVETRPAVPPATVPTYSPVPPSYQQSAATPVNQTRPTLTAATPPVTKTIKQSGQLYKAQHYDGINQAYYLVNSQGTSTYYVMAMTTSGINLSQYVGRFVEVEGIVVDRRQQLGKEQINVIALKVLP